MSGDDQPTALDARTPTPGLAPEGTLASGSRIGGRYLLLDEIGRGGFGVVYRAIDQRLGRNVALKVLPGVGASEDDHARFSREALILASLDHVNVVTVFDAGLDDGRPYFAMKLVRGRPLSRKLDGSPLPGREAAGIAAQIASALAHAHERGIFHRDVKPSNVLEEGDGRWLLADFGISTAGFLPRVTERGTVMGTLDYLAPEALSGEAVAASDLYSLGVVLYEMLLGRPCFRGGDPRALFHRILSETPSGLLAPPAEVPPALLDLLHRLLAKDPSARPASAALLRDELARLSASADPSPAAPPAASQSPEATRSTDGPDSGEVLDRLEREVEAISRVLEAGSGDLDATVDALAGFVGEAGRLAERLVAERRERAEPDPLRLTLALSVSHLAREVLRRASAHSRGPVLSGLLRRLHSAVVTPIDVLVAELQRGSPAAAPEGFLEIDEAEPIEGGWDVDVLLSALAGEDDLRRHDAAIQVVRDADPFLAAIRERSAAERDRYLRPVFDSADVVLVEGRRHWRGLFEAARALSGDPSLASGFELLLELFGRRGQGAADALSRAAARAPEERRAVGRALLFHPEAALRRLSFELLEPADFWPAIAHSGTPVGWLLEIWRGLRPRVGPDFQKVFFACIHDSLARPGDSARIVDVVEMVKELYRVEAFHEDVFFRMLVDLDERVRVEGRRHRLLVDFDAEYVERLGGFLAEGTRLSQPVSEWGSVPLAIQRKLARRGRFVRHFSCHPVDPIALETLPHLERLESVVDYVCQAAINGKLLVELAKERRLFGREDARMALVQNPKTPAFLVLKHIGFLRKDNLRKLAESREGNQLSRQYALKLLGRGGVPGAAAGS